VFAGKKSAQIREILISESAWEEMTCLFAPSLLHLNPRRDRGFLSPPWTAHKVQQLFLHLVKRLPTIAAIVYSKLLQFCGDDRHKWP
ncbi:hypothetical protein L6P94_01920, partial [Klebsiella pneumoniae]|nr:hypothetical protein [Klebsiella pneumoniae]MCL3472763.1 hypothetical protein [Klebsiella pneumoniae]MCL3506089.1 hypothetical protein [Klebsiella pneumoniae]MCL3511546.1 hypothetical protein [Klebsiella pneumoniae]MCL3539085.1 hypothetical protein [Klebsiella pneumoniae]